MKKTLLIIKLFLLVALFIFILYITFFNKFDFSFTTVTREYDTYTKVQQSAIIDDSIQDIEVLAISADIEVVESNDAHITILYDNSNAMNLYYKVIEDQLLIEIEQHETSWFGFNFSNIKENTIKILVPSSLLPTLQISNVSSDMDININTQSILVQTVSGPLTITHQTEEIEFDSVSGNLNVIAYDNTEIDMRSVSGDIIYTGPDYDLKHDTVGDRTDHTSIDATVEITLNGVSSNFVLNP